MLKKLLEPNNRDEITDAFHLKINDTIDYHIDVDIFHQILPSLSAKKTKISDDYFRVNKITPNSAKSWTSKELKTIAHLAGFWKEKTKYNIVEANRYLNYLGYDVDLENKVIDLKAIDKTNTIIDNEKNITYTKYLLLSNTNYLEYNYLTKHNIQNPLSHLVNHEFYNGYIDGFDILFDSIGMK